MRGTKAKQLRKLARAIGKEMGLKHWLEYRMLGPFKKKILVINRLTGTPSKDPITGKPQKITITVYTTINAGIRGLYRQLKKQHSTGIDFINRGKEIASQYQKAA